MNRTDAAAILGIDASASPEEAKRVYQELFTEHQVRLTNAPTPALRSLYQARLLELDDARDALLAGSMGDADSDLPTDQPSVPNYRSNEQPQRQSSPPPPPAATSARVEEHPPLPQPKRKSAAEPPRAETVREGPAQAAKKSSASKWIGAAIGLIVVVGALSQLPRLSKNRSSAATKADSTNVVASRGTVADPLPKIRENITVARVEFGRGDYDAANGALKDADTSFSRIDAGARGDTAVVQIESQLDSLHAKVRRACDALKKVAARHPGEPTCKSL